MKVRFESLFRTKYCEKCGKAAKWRCIAPISSMIAPINIINYYCDNCVKDK